MKLMVMMEMDEEREVGLRPNARCLLVGLVADPAPPLDPILLDSCPLHSLYMFFSPFLPFNFFKKFIL